MSTNTNTSFNLGTYVRDVFDLNKDGKVTFKEFLSTVIPGKAIGLALLAVDVLALVGEYRVWQVGMAISGNDPYEALGFVAISIVPFLLAEVLWLYPMATFFQQAIAVVMGLTALLTSVQFGFADLSQQYDVATISKWVTWLWFFYIVLLLLYVVNDRAFKLMRTRIQARANANFQNAMNDTTSDILASLEQSLLREQELRKRFGDDAVNAHLELLRARGGSNHKLPAPTNPSTPPPQKN